MRCCRRQVWRPKRQGGRAVLPVRLTLKDEVQLVDGIRGGVCPVAVVNPARCQRCPHGVEDGRFLPSGPVFWRMPVRRTGRTISKLRKEREKGREESSLYEL
jgi:hypothetical protein